MKQILQRHRGVTGVPLSYVVTKAIAVPDTANKGIAENYPLMEMEMKARAPIRNDADDGFVDLYRADREHVWRILFDSTRDNADGWEYVKAAQATTDGRTTFWNLINRYLGQNQR